MSNQEQSDDDQMALCAAFMWKRMPADARNAVINSMSLDDEDKLTEMVHHGRKLKRQRK
jgi:hypothetical protein